MAAFKFDVGPNAFFLFFILFFSFAPIGSGPTCRKLVLLALFGAGMCWVLPYGGVILSVGPFKPSSGLHSLLGPVRRDWCRSSSHRPVISSFFPWSDEWMRPDHRAGITGFVFMLHDLDYELHAIRRWFSTDGLVIMIPLYMRLCARARTHTHIHNAPSPLWIVKFTVFLVKFWPIFLFLIHFPMPHSLGIWRSTFYSNATWKPHGKSVVMIWSS